MNLEEQLACIKERCSTGRLTSKKGSVTDMTCFLCKGTLENKKTTYMVDIGNHIIIKNVPSKVCRQCGDTTYTNEVAERLEAIVASRRRTLTEIAVFD